MVFFDRKIWQKKAIGFKFAMVFMVLVFKIVRIDVSRDR